LVADPENQIWVSSVSAFEMATKFRIEKWPDIGELARNFEQQSEPRISSASRRSLTRNRRRVARRQSSRDPFDRLLAAQSLVENIPLITGDPAFKGFGVETAW